MARETALSRKYAAYPEYKASGVEWLNDVPSHWGAKPLKFMCTYNDEVLADSVSDDHEIEYVDIGSVSATTGITKIESMAFGKAPSRARRIVRDGDVIISTVRTYLEAIAPIDNPPENLVVSTGFAVIRPNKLLHKGYAAYCLRANGFIKEVVAQSVGVSYPAINATDLVNIKAPEPAFEEQQNIANFLDHETAKIDTLIDKQQQLITLLKEKRQAVISHAVTKGLPSVTGSKAPMRDSGVEWLGEVPAHWEVQRLKFACELITQKVHIGSKRTIALENIESWTGKYVPTDSLYSGEDVEYDNGDVLFGKLRPYLAKVYFAEERGVAFGDLLVYRPKDNFQSKYCFYQMINESFINKVNSSTYGSKMPRASADFISDMQVLLPPIQEQEEILTYIEKALDKFYEIEVNAKMAITLMKERRTALISAAVTGKIDVSNWQAPVTTNNHKEVAP
jgi:type I restriction enzyme S subunit